MVWRARWKSPSPLWGRGVGERGRKRMENARQYALFILQYIVVPEAQDTKTLRHQVSIAPHIVGTFRVLPAVGLND